MQANYLTPLAASELLGISKQAVQKKINTGELAAEKSVSISKNGKAYSTYHIAIGALPREAQLKWALLQDRTDNGSFDLVGYKVKFGAEGVERLMDRQDAVRERRRSQCALAESP